MLIPLFIRVLNVYKFVDYFNKGDTMEKTRYFSASQFFKKKFGTKIIKLPIDAGFTCPNRDGTLSSSGCIFCSEKGSGDFAGEKDDEIATQINKMKEKLSHKSSSNKYMAYFQAFTNTYAPIKELREKYYSALNEENIVALSIATRPDCINEEIVKLLAELSKKVYVCVELGFQTSKAETIELINRCYENKIFENSVKLLNKYNIDIICHVILGLPYETKEDMLNTVKYVTSFNISGIKLQLLHILKNTELEKLYNEKGFKVLTLEEYVDLIVCSIEILPPNIVVHRITGDGDKNLLIEPKFSLNKRLVLNSINKELKLRDTYQGKYFKN